jgi:hypothetical protein
MGDSERIAALERELAQLRAAFADSASSHQYLGGDQRAFQCAVLALVETQGAPERFAERLRLHLAQVDAGIVAESIAEEHLQGWQAGCESLIVALEILNKPQNS